MGHVPAGPIPQAGARDDVPRRQHRGTGSARAAAARGVGRFGERLAIAFLERRGASIIGTNLRVGHDEIDVLAVIAGTRVAVEVKTRIGEEPAEEVTDQQVRRLRRAMLAISPPAERGDMIAVRLGAAGATLSWRRSVA